MIELTPLQAKVLWLFNQDRIGMEAAGYTTQRIIWRLNGQPTSDIIDALEFLVGQGFVEVFPNGTFGMTAAGLQWRTEVSAAAGGT